jgi:hypothetical protein
MSFPHESGAVEAPQTPETTETAGTENPPSSRYMAKPGDSYTKLAMRNMVRRGGTSLLHFGLTTVALLSLLVGLAYLFR